MLITFKSAADADVLMFGDVAKAMLIAMGKDANDRQGIVTQDQLPQALARLREAMRASKATTTGHDEAAEDDPDAPRGMAAPVSFFQRAAPLVQMLELASRQGVPVIWEAQG